MVEGMSVVVNVMLSLMSIMSPPIGSHCCEVMYFGCFGFRDELGFLNCDYVCMCVVNKQFELLEFGCFGFRDELGFLNRDYVCMCVVNKQFELLEFVFDSVYVDLQYDEISLTFTAGHVSLCCVCGRLWSICEVVVVPYVVAVTVLRVPLFVLHVCC